MFSFERRHCSVYSDEGVQFTTAEVFNLAAVFIYAEGAREKVGNFLVPAANRWLDTQALSLALLFCGSGGGNRQKIKFPLRKKVSVRGFYIFYFSSSFFIISGPCSTKIPVAAAFFSVKEGMPFFFTRLS